MLSNIPNILTLMRIALIPVFVAFFYLPVEHANQICAGIFALAAVTDWLDGFLARKLGQMSAFGAFLDPVADKLMVITALILLVEVDPTPALAIPTIIIIGREISVSALREWMAEVGERAKVAVTIIAKIKTAAQMIAILLLIYREPLWDIPVYTIGYVLLYVSAVLTVWSMFVYLKAALPSLNGSVADEQRNQEDKG
ncbi:MAG: CDP-diacylglycerol--glycerol-3-phosphate 3-phosphatidyltransferase [Gammaproteobacteria bacterium]|nr:CDP-diacylglycerol--glycerol-3-phosphate 3-phosphatidyltransferase [Gammaproteobacteria bacterium]